MWRCYYSPSVKPSAVDRLCISLFHHSQASRARQGIDVRASILEETPEGSSFNNDLGLLSQTRVVPWIQRQHKDNRSSRGVLLIFRGAYGPGAPTYCQYPPTARRNLSKGPEVTHMLEKARVRRLSKSTSITAHALRRRCTDCDVIFLCQDFAYLQKVHQLPNWMSRGLRSQWNAAECKTYLGKNVDRCRESHVYAAFGKRYSEHISLSMRHQSEASAVLECKAVVGKNDKYQYQSLRLLKLFGMHC